MALANTRFEYGAVAKWLHWLVALGILALVILGLLQSDMDSGPQRSAIRELHGSIALLVLVLMILRLGWRWSNVTPAHPHGVPGWQRASAALVHAAIYLAVFVQLVSGAMAVATGGKPLAFFGLFSIPLPVAEDHDRHELWEEVHEAGWMAIAALVAVHVLAALYHHFILKNDVLRRMTVGAQRDRLRG
ncbi:MAG TPA: cytochrome b [Woeseiaceae bacterium]|nr:cytochrome b [Woeseiaceae bacterium]